MSSDADIPINDKLRELGVTKFVKQGDLVQIIVSKHKAISFIIHPKEFQRMTERFRESALNNIAYLSEEIINKMERVLVHHDNDHIRYLQLNSNGKRESESRSDIENLNRTYTTVYADKISLYEAIIIDSLPVFAKISLGSSKISLCTEIQLSSDHEAPQN